MIMPDVQPNPMYRVIARSGLNVREGPGISFPKTGVLNFNELVMKNNENEDGTWIYISSPGNNITGWCSAQYLQSYQGVLDAVKHDYAKKETISITYPAKGVTRIKGQAFWTTYYLTLCRPEDIEIEVVHEFNRPSVIAMKRGATFAFNGDDWDRASRQVIGMEICNGIMFQTRSQRGEPSLIVTKDGHVHIGHQNIPNQWNVSSGLRYLVKDRKNQIPQNRLEPKYSEKHARSIRGIHQDGRVMFLTVDGDYIYTGMTLWECAEIMIHYGCDVAIDGGGGGDSVDVAFGRITNTPDDQDQQGNPFERSVPQTILVFTSPSDDTMFEMLKHKGKPIPK